MTSSRELREQLAKSLDEAEWQWLAPHARRDALILVHSELDLLVAAEAVARDLRDAVGDWVAKGWMRKPTSLEMSTWAAFPERRMKMIVVQPFVLAQEK